MTAASDRLNFNLDVRFTDCQKSARTLLDLDFVRTLAEIRPGAAVRATVVLWIQLLASWAIALFGPIWLLWLPIVINSAVTQGMLLWVHEASHFTLLRNKSRNDIWCDVFFAGPIGMSVSAYRARHMTHHSHLGTVGDKDSYPYRMNIKGMRALAGVLAKSMSGGLGLWLAFDKYGLKAPEKGAEIVSPRWIAPAVSLIFNTALLAACVAVGRWYVYFAVWVYPILAIAITLNIVRTIAEHQPEDFSSMAIGTEKPMVVVRTTVPNFFEKWLMYQANFNYHVEHHLFPAIPQHNLARLHAHFQERGFYKQFPGSIQRSGFWKFVLLSRNREHDDFSGPVDEALTSR